MTAVEVEVKIDGITFKTSPEGMRWLYEKISNATVTNPPYKEKDTPSRPRERTSAPSPWELASQALGRPATAEEINEQMIAMGNPSSAANPVAALKRAIRYNSLEFRKMGVKDGETLWQWFPAGEEEPESTSA